MTRVRPKKRSPILTSLETEALRTGEMEGLRSEVALRTAEADSLRRDVVSRAAEAESLRHELASQAAEADVLHNDIASRAAEAENLRHALASRAAEAEVLRNDIASRAAQAVSLRKEIAAVLSEANRLDVELNTACNRLAELQSALETRSAEAVRLGSELSDSRFRITELNAALQANAEELRSVKSSFSWRVTKLLRFIAEKRMKLNEARLISSSGMFDRDWYFQQYPEVRAGVDPIMHYLQHGAPEGRDPSPLFHTGWYLDTNPDVRAAGVNPLLHYLRHGISEGRHPTSHLKRGPAKAGLIEDYGSACERRTLSYFGLIETLEALPQGESPARKEALADCVKRLKVLSQARNDERRIDVSIVVPAYNHIEYTIACILSVLEHDTKYRYEIIVGNNASVDETCEIFERIDGVVSIVTHPLNEGFIRNCNLSAKRARGQYLVLLNNDTFVLEGWLDALIEPFQTMERIGLVGSKLLMSDGRLQEAGSIVWRDGSCLGYGRGRDPRLPEFNYLKDTDYVSGASIAVPLELWNEIQGFDERYVPAYYDDSDLAFTIRLQNLRVLYQPLSAVIHHEGITHGTDTWTGTKKYQIENSTKFFAKWQHVLRTDHVYSGTSVFTARDRSAKRPHVLAIGCRIPQFDKDGTSYVMFECIGLFVAAGLVVSFWPDNLVYDRPYARALQSIGVEVLYGSQLDNQFGSWIGENGRYIDYVFISGEYSLEKYVHHIRRHSKAKMLVYDLIAKDCSWRAVIEQLASDIPELANLLLGLSQTCSKVGNLENFRAICGKK